MPSLRPASILDTPLDGELSFLRRHYGYFAANKFAGTKGVRVQLQQHMIFRWFMSKTVREALAVHKHYRRLLAAQRDLLSPQAIAPVAGQAG